MRFPHQISTTWVYDSSNVTACAPRGVANSSVEHCPRDGFLNRGRSPSATGAPGPQVCLNPYPDLRLC